MTKYRYRLVCRDCGPIEADTEDGLFSNERTAFRRAGFHEGSRGHEVAVEYGETTPEYRCPVCHTKCVGDQERDEHAKTEPGVRPSSFIRV